MWFSIAFGAFVCCCGFIAFYMLALVSLFDAFAWWCCDWCVVLIVLCLYSAYGCYFDLVGTLLFNCVWL